MLLSVYQFCCLHQVESVFERPPVAGGEKADEESTFQSK